MRSKHIKGSKERYLLGQKHNLQIFRVIPLGRLGEGSDGISWGSGWDSMM